MIGSTSAVEAIRFSLEVDEGDIFLRLWNSGDFDAIRKEWPECPESILRGSTVLPGEATFFRAKAYSVECPRCQYEHVELIQDPRGLEIECEGEGCGKTFTVPAHCDIEVS